MGNVQHYVTAKESPGNIRPGENQVEKQGDPQTRERFQGTDEEYVLRFAEKAFLSKSAHYNGVFRKNPPAVVSFYAG